MKALTVILSILMSLGLHAQIGYQVAVLNSATGTPRANENVSVAVTITDSEDATLYKQTQSVMTNEFGIASLTVGNADTFSAVDWSKLPFFISATIDGKMIGKTQILSVPVAEYAKQSGPTLTKEMLIGTWKHEEEWESGRAIEYIFTYDFHADGTCLYTYLHLYDDEPYKEDRLYRYALIGDKIFLYDNGNIQGYHTGPFLIYLNETGELYSPSGWHYFTKQQ